MVKSITVLLCLFLLSAPSLTQPAPQTFPASPDRFKWFILNETTPDDIIKLLGTPDADKTNNLDVSKIGKWLDPKYKEKIFRQLSYTKSSDFLKIELSFLDGKLVMIDLEYKKNIQPDKLMNLFNIEFAHLGGPASLPNKPGQYPIPFFPTGFPPAYSMVASSEKTFIYVNCGTGDTSSPGRVERTRQISRVLEKK